MKKPQKSKERDQILHIRFNDKEIAMLKTIAEENGLTVAAAMRLMVRREHKAILREASAA